MPRVASAIVSDLHLGTVTGADIARRGEPRERLLAALDGADRVVLLGDILELRELPLARVLELARPFFEALGEVTAGRRVTLLAGNHDHQLADPWLAQLRIDGDELGPAKEWTVEPGDGAAGQLAELMPGTGLTVAYPGVLLRPDVYATHGHYLDLHLTVPRLESIAASAMGRLTGLGKAAGSAADYETILAPMYAFYSGLAQGASARGLARGGSLSRTVWQLASDGRAVPDASTGTALDGTAGPASSGTAGSAPDPPAASAHARAVATRFLLGRVTIPGAVAALNGLGLGPFRATLTGEELRRAGLLAMARVAEVLAPGAEHVVFGHTHRPGPLARDDAAEWTTLSGTRLWNSGSWLHEAAFVKTGRDSPYWPGTVLTLEDEGPPRLENVLAG
jgi:predicted phosphodiesterase